MPTIIQTAQGTVTGLWGSAVIKGADGRARPLKIGDVVRRGDVILTTQDGIVQLTADEVAAPAAAATAASSAPSATRPAAVTAPAGTEVDQVIGQLAQNDPDAAPAAGLTGGDEGEFRPGLRVDRITELLTPLALGATDDNAQGLTQIDGTDDDLGALQINIAPEALDASLSGVENTLIPIALVGTDGDGTVVSVTVTAIPPGGGLLLADGSTAVTVGQTLTPQQAAGLLFRPATDFVGQAAIGFFVIDNQGLTSDSGTVSINVADSAAPPSNQAPMALNDSATVPEDSAASGNLLDNDSDPDGDALVITQFSFNGVAYAPGATATVPGVGSLTIGANGSYTFTPVADYSGPVPLASYTVSDGSASITATLALAVSPVGDAPLAAPDTVAATEDLPVTFDPRGNDRDADGNPLSITAIAGQPIALGSPVSLPQGTVALNADGTLTFTPNPNFNGPLVFDYTVSDGSSTSTAQVTVNVAPVNDAPVAADDLASTPVNTPATITVLANDRDVDGDPISVTGATVDPALGTVTVNPNGTLAFTPANNLSGPVLINYTISDGQGGSASATVTVNIGPNTPPTGGDSTVVVAEDGSRPFSAADFGFTDADAGQTFANVRIDALPGAGALTLNGVAVAAGQVIAVADLGTLVFTPAPNANGNAYTRFTFSVQDSSGAFDVAPNQIIIDVTPVSDAALIGGAASGATVEDMTLVTGGTLTVSDPDAGEAAFNPQTNVAGTYGSFAIDAAGVWAYTLNNADPTVQALGAGQTLPSETFTVTTIDGASQVVTVTITGTNDAAVIGGVAVGSVTEDGVAVSSGNLTVSDVDGPSVFVAGGAAGTYGDFAVDAAGAWTYTLRNGDANVQALTSAQQPVESFTVTAADGTSSTVTVTVNGANEAPVAVVTSASGNEDSADIPVLLGGSDADGSVASFTIGSLPANGVLLFNGSPVTVGLIIPATAGAATLSFVPAAHFNGSTAFEFSATDNEGARSPSVAVPISVAAVNDGPVAIDDIASTAINTPISNIAVLANDSDADNDLLTVTAAVLANPAQGTVSINPNGTLNFTPATNLSGPVLISYTISDGQGGVTNATLTVNVGANTPPTGGDAAVVVAEDGSRPFSAADFGFTDADAGQSFANVRIDALPGAGLLALNGVAVTVGQVIAVADLGNLVFTPAPNASGNGYASFTFSVQDSSGAFDATPNQITVNVTPVPDAALIGGAASGATVEDTTPVTGGTLTVADPDAGEAVFNPLANIAGAHGSFSIDAAGAWTYTLNNADPAVQALGAGQTLPNEVFTVTTIDGTSQVVTVSITGTNDAAVISSAAGTVTEDALLATSGTLTVTDIDGPASFVAQPTTPGSYGTFTLDAVGQWTYALANALPVVQALGAGQTLTETFAVAAADGTPSSVTVTIVGTDDAPLVSADSGAVIENTQPQVSGTLSASDADNPALAFNAGTTSGNYGALVLSADGAWSYTLDSRAEPLAQGQTVGDTITVSLNDGSTTTVTVTITGTNDAAVIGGVAVGSVTEDGVAVSSGNLTVSDVDGPSVFVAGGAAGTYGDFAVDAAGAWTYTLRNGDANVQALTSAQQPVESFTVTAADGTTSTVSVTVNGANEAPVAVVTSASGNEDSPGIPVLLGGSDADGSVASFTIGSLPANGVLLFNGSPVTVGLIVPATAGAATLSFVPAPHFNGSTAFEFSATDNEGARSPSVAVPISVAAVGDPALIGGAASGAATEDTTLTTSGTLTVGDPDAGEAAFNPQSNVAGTYGSFTIDAAGAWTYTLNNADAAVQALGAGQTLPSETFTVTTADGTSQVVTVSITGTNDVPVAQGANVSVTEDAPVVTGSVVATDTDANALLSYSLNAAAPAGLTFNPNGSYSFDASNAAYQSLAAGQTQVLTVPYTVTDEQGATSTANLSITITGTNDAAVIGGVAVGSVTEDGVAVSSGNLTVSDVDGPSVFVAGGAAGTYGDFAVDAAGAWTYTLRNGDANVQALTSAQQPVESFTVTAADGTTSTVSVTVNGANEPPLAVVTSASGNEDSPGIPVLLGGSDADGSVASFTIGSLPANGVLLFNGSPVTVGLIVPATAGAATLSFVPAAHFNGSTAFEFSATDNEGARSPSVAVPISVAAVNDGPVARNDQGNLTAAQTLAVSAAEGVILSNTVAAGRDTDIDGDTLTVTLIGTGTGTPATVVPAGGVTVAGTYGDLLLRPDGSYAYTANRADAIATGAQASDVFTYQVADGRGGLATASLTLQISGVADTLTAAPPTTTALNTPLGLNGEYYGYNDFNPGPTSPNRRHADDGSFGNLDRVTDIEGIVNGRNAVFGGVGTPGIVGTSASALADAADARFTARLIDYGTSPTVTGTLGSNPNIAAGGSTAGLTNGNSQFYRFLNGGTGADATSIVVRQGTADNDTAGGGPTSGLGRTSDVALRITGQAYLAAGLYDIRVRADDGFRLKLDDQTVAIFNDIQSPTTRVYTGVPIEGGLTPLELIYWEQGGNAVLRVEFKPSGTPDSAYQVLGSQAVPLFSNSSAPVLTDLQDIVAGPTPGSYLVRTGSLLDGGNGDDSLTGSAGRDSLIGGQGRDTLTGGAGDDSIRGGSGNDRLTGGAGHDVLRWSLGDAGPAGTPARDLITDFDNTPHGGDVLDLRDLLVGESHLANGLTLPGSIGLNNAATITTDPGNLSSYLHFSTVGGDTVVEISSSGGFAGSYTPAAVDQVITLAGLNLVGSFSNDNQVISDLLQRGKLVTD